MVLDSTLSTSLHSSYINIKELQLNYHQSLKHSTTFCRTQEKFKITIWLIKLEWETWLTTNLYILTKTKINHWQERKRNRFCFSISILWPGLEIHLDQQKSKQLAFQGMGAGPWRPWVVTLLSSITTSFQNQFTDYNSGQEVGGGKCHIICRKEEFSRRNAKARVSMGNLPVDVQFSNFEDSLLSV